MGGDLILSGHTLDLCSVGTLEGVLTIFGRYFKRSTFLFFSLKIQEYKNRSKGAIPYSTYLGSTYIVPNLFPNFMCI